MKKVGRRFTLVGSLLITGLACLATGLVPSGRVKILIHTLVYLPIFPINIYFLNKIENKTKVLRNSGIIFIHMRR